MKKFISKITLLCLLFLPQLTNLQALEITNFSAFGGMVNITVALDDLDKQAMVRCIVYNEKGKPVAQQTGYIMGVGTIYISAPTSSNTTAKCDEKK